jgi:hypothetical protein
MSEEDLIGFGTICDLLSGIRSSAGYCPSTGEDVLAIPG